MRAGEGKVRQTVENRCVIGGNLVGEKSWQIAINNAYLDFASAGFEIEKYFHALHTSYVYLFTTTHICSAVCILCSLEIRKEHLARDLCFMGLDLYANKFYLASALIFSVISCLCLAQVRRSYYSTLMRPLYALSFIAPHAIFHCLTPARTSFVRD